ncbi:MAG: bifunctional 2-polyprenyl-6-hydroxyphenol methylase/3-demethylubiquinol 3-O-methyltransferase UbiG [Rickettsiaceae bacterium]|nr:MAG: bifunctional 2-polyprenyl-6-hydroxyphenol methylase/3-demethylubiquinol 3-O-methyltransferase UbiG [Rickettsiaceae bacterium]
MNDYSVDIDELTKFDRSSGQWWNKEGEFKMLHQINPLRIKLIITSTLQHFQITASIGKPLSNLDILDVGCGGGLISVPISKLGAKVTGIDASYKNIDAAMNYSKGLGLDINYLNSSVNALVQQKKLFDVVLCLEVIEHVADVEHFISDLCKLVKNDGLLIISTINRNIKSYLQVVLLAEYVLRWVPKHTHDYRKFLKPSELNNHLSKNQMVINELIGLKYNPIKGWNLSSNVDANYFACVSKINT